MKFFINIWKIKNKKKKTLLERKENYKIKNFIYKERVWIYYNYGFMGNSKQDVNHKESIYFEKYQHNYYFSKVIAMEPIYRNLNLTFKWSYIFCSL